MRIVVADTSPLRYLLEIGEIELLPRLFEKVTIPSVVRDELLHASAPAAVRNWIGTAPVWLDVKTAAPGEDPALRSLDAGERAAIALGLSLAADIVLIDDRKGAAVARVKGFEVIGTLGILSLAAERHMVDLSDAITRLKVTNFRMRDAVLDALMKRHGL